MPPESPQNSFSILARLRTWFQSLTKWEQCAVATWSIAVLVISILAFCSPRSHSVYPIFAGAARNWLAGANAYHRDSDPYRYSPLVTVLLVPFGALPDAVGAVLWRWINAAVACFALIWWSRTALPTPLTRKLQGLLLLLFAPSAIANLYNGQSNLLVVGLLLAGIAAVVAQRWNLAAICVALACLFKLYPIALGLLLVVAFPKRFATRFASALAVGLLLPFVCQNPDYVLDQYVQWFHQVSRNDRQVLSTTLWYRDLRLLFGVWLRPISIHTYQMIQAAAAMLCAGLVLLAQRSGWPQNKLLALILGLSCCWMTVLGPATESCTYVLLGPVGAWAVIDAFQQRSWMLRGLFSSGFGLLIIAQLSTWFPFGRAFHSLGPQPLAGLLILAGFLVKYVLEFSSSMTVAKPARVVDNARAA